MAVMTEKYTRLKDSLRFYGSMLVCFSGGVDSTFLLKAATDTLGTENAAGLLVESEFYPRRVLDEARATAHRIGARLEVVEFNLAEVPAISSNPADRCYHCKRYIMETALDKARSWGLDLVVDGTMTDDLGEHRPGLKALEELGVKSPLAETGLNKEEIRKLSKELGLPTWNKKSYTCLATRFPTGEKITPEKLDMVERCETALDEEGFGFYRVRYHGDVARVELAPEDLPRILEGGVSERISRAFHEAGFRYVTVDLEGYRSGSVGEPNPEIKEKQAKR